MDSETSPGPGERDTQRRTIPNDYSRYSPLNPLAKEIRLIKLHPGTKEDDITCSLIQVSLLDSPRYEAISYCWGDLGEIRSIKVEYLDSSAEPCDLTRTSSDQTENELFDFNIAASLHDFLSRIRNQHEPRFLWADAICINQGDKSERSHQVNFMRTVYENVT